MKQEIINVEYHNGNVLNRSDDRLNKLVNEGSLIMIAIPVLSNVGSAGYPVVQTTSIQYIVQLREHVKPTDI